MIKVTVAVTFTMKGFMEIPWDGSLSLYRELGAPNSRCRRAMIVGPSALLHSLDVPCRI